MENHELRQPVQKRAIEKKNRIIECGFKLMCEKGYHNVDCIEIAKVSDVATGTIYQYFKDKRDIFLQGLQKEASGKLFPILEFKDKKITKDTLYSTIDKIITVSIKKHTMSQIAHEEIMAMQHSDSDVAKIFEKYELEATNVVVELFEKNGLKLENAYEKAHLIIIWIDDLCHEIVYHKHDNINYDKMKELVINSIINLLK
jgi:hypothetical protein